MGNNFCPAVTEFKQNKLMYIWQSLCRHIICREKSSSLWDWQYNTSSLWPRQKYNWFAWKLCLFGKNGHKRICFQIPKALSLSLYSHRKLLTKTSLVVKENTTYFYFSLDLYSYEVSDVSCTMWKFGAQSKITSQLIFWIKN